MAFQHRIKIDIRFNEHDNEEHFIESVRELISALKSEFEGAVISRIEWGSLRPWIGEHK